MMTRRTDESVNKEEPKIKLRDYQEELLKKLDDYLATKTGNPCAVLATGAGKGFCIAAFLQRKLESNPELKLLMVTHQKELIEQNTEKLLEIWPDAPVGIYSASVGEKELTKPITMAGIQSLIRAKDIIGYDYVIVDEAHRINNEKVGSYRKLFDKILEKNPKMRVVGFTATPYRLGQGMITDSPAIFSGMVRSISTAQLQEQGYLAYLTTKQTEIVYNTKGIPVRGGEYALKELQERVTSFNGNGSVCDEIVASAKKFKKKHILIFCVGVSHAEKIAQMLDRRGLITEIVTGDMDKSKREKILSDFKSGRLQAIASVNVVTTGFDYPEVDMIAMLRPTKSTSLHVQMLGRGLRKKKNGGTCLVLDFVGNTAEHGPINAIYPPKKHKKKGSRGPITQETKICPKCKEIVLQRISTCPSCGYKWPAKEIVYSLTGIDVNGDMNKGCLFPAKWFWYPTKEKKSGKPMLMCFFDPPGKKQGYCELFCINSGSEIIRNDARNRLDSILSRFDLDDIEERDEKWIREKAAHLNKRKAPDCVIWKRETGFNNARIYTTTQMYWVNDSRAEVEALTRLVEEGGAFGSLDESGNSDNTRRKAQ